jgi:hypothetical protein
MAGGHPHREPTSEKTPHDPAAKEAGPSEHGDQSPALRRAPFGAYCRHRHLASPTNVLAIVTSGRVVSPAPTISIKWP